MNKTIEALQAGINATKPETQQMMLPKPFGKF